MTAHSSRDDQWFVVGQILGRVVWTTLGVIIGLAIGLWLLKVCA